MSRQDLNGKVAWITGAGSGIGQAAAQTLAKAGVTVVLSGRREEALQETLRTIEQAGGQGAVEVLNIADQARVHEVAERIEQRYGRLDILLNNAGINIVRRNWSDPDLAAWDRLIQININGLYYCVAAVLPLMRRQQDGLIINISSWAGRYNSRVAGVAYGASKHAVLALNASINMEEGQHGIRACAISPAEVATPIMQQRPVQPTEEQLARMLQPDDLAETVLYVAGMPARACVNEILISPTWTRAYFADSERLP